jgi:hypothetical protein
MARVWAILSGVVLALAGCLGGEHAYLRFSQDFDLPLEYADPATYRPLLDQWTRSASLGLEGAVAAVIEDPAVAAAMVAEAASRSHSAFGPGQAARETWQDLYHAGERLPLRVRLRCDRNFHKAEDADPASWTFRLRDEAGREFQPVATSSVVVADTREAWIRECRIWFPRRTVSGVTLIGNRTRMLDLVVRGEGGDAILHWRFTPLLGNPARGPLDP